MLPEFFAFITHCCQFVINNNIEVTGSDVWKVLGEISKGILHE